MIIEALLEIHKQHRLLEGNVSEHTKSAQLITREWQGEVCVGEIEKEVRVSPDNNERIDIVDKRAKTAYELKVSGKNTHHEFYKNLVKVLTYNEYQEKGEKLSKLVFISEKTGIALLQSRLDARFCKMLTEMHGLSIELVGI